MGESVTQPDCSEYLEVQDAPEPLPSHSPMPANLMWIAIFAAVIAFELWAIVTDNYTLSEAVWSWPKWGKWLLGGGFAVLLFHLFLQR